MEKLRVSEQETLINELTQGYEFTKQLKRHIDPLTSPESCEFLIQKIISTYDKALSVLNLGDLVGEFHQGAAGSVGPACSSELKDHQCQKDFFKKRKTSPRWTEQVRVCSGGLGDDGYNWRKYGQKDILGASFPRAYYRCTHRHVQGCLATKQVQKSDADPSIFEITYRARHTCIQTPVSASKGNEFAKQKPEDHCHQPHLQEEIQSPLQLKSEDMGLADAIFPSFSFPSTPIESENVEPLFFPETSDSNFLSLLQFPIENFGFGENLQHSESDLSEMISAPTSIPNSPTGNVDFLSLDQFDIDSNFQLDISAFFC